MYCLNFLVGELIVPYIITLAATFVYIPNLKRYSLVYKVSDGCTMVAVNLYIVLSNRMWSHDHGTTVAAIIFI